MAVQTEHVLFRPDYQAGERATTVEPTEQQQLSHAFTDTPSVFRLLSTVRSRRFGMGYRYETGESETLTWSQNRTVSTERGPLAYKSAQNPHPLAEVEEAMSHPQALGQCRHWLRGKGIRNGKEFVKLTIPGGGGATAVIIELGLLPFHERLEVAHHHRIVDRELGAEAGEAVGMGRDRHIVPGGKILDVHP